MKFARHALALLALIGALGMASSPASAQAPTPAPQQKDLFLRDDARCTSCHDEADNPDLLAIGKRRHGVTADERTPTCTSCHGESLQHEKDANAQKKEIAPPDVAFSKKSTNTADEKSGACLTCHQGGNRIHFASSTHAENDVACSSCHDIHTPHDKARTVKTQTEVCFTCHQDKRADIHKPSSHPIRAGQMACSSCHNPHGSIAQGMLVKETVNQTCYTCHAEKRGPFLFEHPPAADNCSNCHNPHGSVQAPLLKTRGPFLCQQCHDFTQHPGNPYSGTGLPVSAGGTSPAQQLLLRNCANCHSQVHGTNSPSGARFTR